MSKRNPVRDSGFGEGRESLPFAGNLSREVINEEETMAQPDANVPIVAPVTQVVQGKIPPYSGVSIGDQYQGTSGVCQEMFTASAWCSHVETVSKAAGWTELVTINQAILNLVPGSPAGFWHQRQVIDKKDLTTWDKFRLAITQEFSVAVDTAKRWEIMKTFVQGKNEKTSAFLNRLAVGHNEVMQGMTVTPPPRGTEQATVDLVTSRVKEVMDYHLGMFFLMGLREPMLSDVTKSGETSISKMLEVARRTENALAQAKKANVGAVSNPPDIQALIDKAVAQALKNKQPQAGEVAAVGGNSGKKNKARDVKDVKCFYCLTNGHYATNCAQRKTDREAGKWRPTVKDSPMTKEQYDQLSPTEKLKGKSMATGGAAAAVVPGVSFANAAQGQFQVPPPVLPSDEDRWNAYLGN